MVMAASDPAQSYSSHEYMASALVYHGGYIYDGVQHANAKIRRCFPVQLPGS
jgi:hypothetical protein